MSFVKSTADRPVCLSFLRAHICTVNGKKRSNKELRIEVQIKHSLTVNESSGNDS